MFISTINNTSPQQSSDQQQPRNISQSNPKQNLQEFTRDRYFFRYHKPENKYNKIIMWRKIPLWFLQITTWCKKLAEHINQWNLNEINMNIQTKQKLTTSNFPAAFTLICINPTRILCSTQSLLSFPSAWDELFFGKIKTVFPSLEYSHKI